MKKVLFLLVIYFIGNGLFAQEERSRYQTMTSIMKMSAFKDGQNYMWENKNITVVLDYKIGHFVVRLKNDDFMLDKTEQQLAPDSIHEQREFSFEGFFPIREIIDQKAINQKYVVELQLKNWDLSLDNTINFDLNVTNPGSSNKGNYRIFQLHGKLYHYELGLPGFEGFDNEIEIWISFNGYSIIR